jgi:DNA-binding NarL/FixJ family response regulator
VADASQALLHLQSPLGSFAAIILDLNLPGMDGFEFLQCLRQQPTLKARAVLVLTGSRDARHRQRVHTYQVAGYFLKDELDQHCTPLLQRLTADQAAPGVLAPTPIPARLAQPRSAAACPTTRLAWPT